jgi:type I restriction enzyme M protein
MSSPAPLVQELRIHDLRTNLHFTLKENPLRRDKVDMDTFWLKHESLKESVNLPAPEDIAAEIAEDLEAALEQVTTIAEDLKEPRTL